MVKKFIVGILCSLGFSFLLLLLFLSFSVYQLMRPNFAEIKPNTVLELKLEHNLQERPLSRGFPFQKTSTASLRDFIDILQSARQDPNIKGLLVHMEKASFTGIAQIQELRNAIRAFRKAGRYAIVYNDTFGELSSGMGAYYFASVFDEIWMQPLGLLNITGLAVIQPFGRKLLDHLGISPEIETREEYKTAYDFAREPGLTPANQQATQEMLNSFLKQMVTGIAQERDLSETAVLDAINQAPIFNLESAVQDGLIDKVSYKDGVYHHLEQKLGKDINLIAFHQYPLKQQTSSSSDAKIAVIFANGMILREARKSNFLFSGASMDTEEITESLNQAIEDPTIKAIVFRIDCPGGSPLASDKLWYALKKVREAKKTLIVSMGDVAASGGYWIATPANKIVANPGTMTGSIGVILGKIASEKFWENIGVQWDTVQTSPNATIWNMIHPYTLEEKKWITGMIDHIYQTFIQKVCQGRHLLPEHVQQIAKGRVWTGEQALQWGLVDVLGDLNTAIELAKTEAGLSDAEKKTVRILYLPKPTSLFYQLSLMLGGELALSQVFSQILNGVWGGLLKQIQLNISDQNKHLLSTSAITVEH